MKTRLLFLAIVMSIFLLPGAAMAQQLFDFYGMVVLPTAEGEALTMHSVIRDASPATTPLPLDFANYEYTIVVKDLILDSDSTVQVYSNGAIAIYQDDMTVATYGDEGSFTDGTALLTGVVTALNRNWIPDFPLGSVSGVVDWTGGTEIGSIAPEDQIGWVFLAATNSRSSTVEVGYDEAWDGKVEPIEPIVGTQKLTWDALKAMF